MEGFLGLGGTFRADLNLTLQILMGAALLVGMRLARRQQFRAHMFCQAAVMLLNAVLIVLIMSPAYHLQVQPQIPARLGEAYYLVAALHAVLGTLAELLGLYIVLVAATKLLPEKLRFRNYKLWMRSALALWWVVILFGVGTYYYWYVAAPPPAATAPSAATAPGGPRVSVKLTNFSFEPKEITVAAGTTVEWIDEKGKHSIVADDGSFESDILDANGRFEHRYDQPGEFLYYCSLHGDKGGKEMAGVVKVR